MSHPLFGDKIPQAIGGVPEGPSRPKVDDRLFPGRLVKPGRNVDMEVMSSVTSTEGRVITAGPNAVPLMRLPGCETLEPRGFGRRVSDYAAELATHDQLITSVAQIMADVEKTGYRKASVNDLIIRAKVTETSACEAGGHHDRRTRFFGADATRFLHECAAVTVFGDFDAEHEPPSASGIIGFAEPVGDAFLPGIGFDQFDAVLCAPIMAIGWNVVDGVCLFYPYALASRDYFGGLFRVVGIPGDLADFPYDEEPMSRFDVMRTNTGADRYRAAAGTDGAYVAWRYGMMTHASHILRTAWMLLKQSKMIAHTDPEPPSAKSLRRAKARKYAYRLPAPVSVVSIRSDRRDLVTGEAPHPGKDRGTETTRQYGRWRFRVRGHARRVRYGPGRKQFRVRWYDDYWKGPEDAPVYPGRRAVELLDRAAREE